MKKIITLLLMLIANHFAFSQWSSDPAINNAICTTTNQQLAERIVADGNGGAIITWWDLDLSTSDYNIYAQRINSAGVVQWTAGGVVICSNPLHQQNPEITSDGNGGAIIVWQDNRSGNCEIYGQKINRSGLVQWAADGISIGNATNCQTFPQLISDGSGGAIVTWKDLRNGSSYRIYTQHINGSGVNLWGTGGVSMSSGTNNQGEPQIVSDGNSGAIISWQEYVGTQYDVYAQRVNAGGAIQWGINGSVICSAPNFQQRTQLTTDENNGAIIIWEDNRTGIGSNTYAQRVNGSGTIQWTLDGIAVGPTGVTQSVRRIITDSSGGAFITWRNGNDQVYAQHISSTGSLIWGATGLLIIAKVNAMDPHLITDGGNGTIITWCDYRGPNSADIFAQRINAAGSFLWTSTGVNICNAISEQVTPQITANGSGGATITWMDSRNSAINSTDIYASKLNSDGTLGEVTVCDKPTGLKAINITSSSAKMKWDIVSGAAKYKLQYRIQGNTTWTEITVTNTSYSITGLTGATIYEYRVQTWCTANGSLKSKYTGVKTFTTAATPFSMSVIHNLQDGVLKIFPNPANDFLNINCSAKKDMVTITIYNAVGKLIKQETRRNEVSIKYNVKTLQSGIYLIQVSDGYTKEIGKFAKQ